MVSKSFTSLLIPRALLLVGLACAVVLAWRNFTQLDAARRALSGAEQAYRMQIASRERCAAQVKQAGGYGDLLDVAIDARCPPMPSYPDPAESFARYQRASRAGTLGLAAGVIVLASLPWLAARWARARIRPPIRA